MIKAHRSAAAAIASYPRREIAFHVVISPRDYAAALSSGRRFQTVTGAPLATTAEVREAMKRDGQVVSVC